MRDQGFHVGAIGAGPHLADEIPLIEGLLGRGHGCLDVGTAQKRQLVICVEQRQQRARDRGEAVERNAHGVDIGEAEIA